MKYLTPREAADILNVSSSTIIAACNRGDFPHAKQVGPGKRWRIPLNDVTAPTAKPTAETSPAQTIDQYAVLKRWGMV